MPAAVVASDPADLTRPDSTDADASDPRTRALRLAREGGLLAPQDLMLIFQLSKSAYQRFAKQGEFDAFLVKGPRLGTRKYSGVLVLRYLEGEDITRTFGAPRGPRR